MDLVLGGPGGDGFFWSVDNRAERAGESELDDGLIQQVAEILRGGVREFDIVVRAATGRFTILLPRTHFTGSLSVATRIWQRLESKVFVSSGKRIEVKTSIGVSF